MDQIFKNRYKYILQSIDKYPREAQWIAMSQEAKMGLKYICYAGSTGYADAAKGYIRSLYEYGIPVITEVAQYHNKSQLTDSDNVFAIGLHNSQMDYNTVIIHTVPEAWPKIVEHERKIRPKCRIYGLTVWETDQLYPAWAETIIRLELTGLILPSEWNRQVFNQVKSMPPIHVCHHAITTSPPSKETITYGGGARTLRLLCIGTWTCRKGIDETIHAYLQAFKKSDDVVLYLKTSDGKYTDKNSFMLLERLHQIIRQYPEPPLIQLDTKLRSDEYIEQLVRESHVFISLCNSEGVGLGACQAASYGKVIVMTGYGGQREYIGHANWVDYNLDEVKVPEGFARWIKPPQRWAYPDLGHAVKLLRDIYRNRNDHMKKASQNIAFIADRFNYYQIGETLAKITDVVSVTGKPKVKETDKVKKKKIKNTYHQSKIKKFD